MESEYGALEKVIRKVNEPRTVRGSSENAVIKRRYLASVIVNTGHPGRIPTPRFVNCDELQPVNAGRGRVSRIWDILRVWVILKEK